MAWIGGALSLVGGLIASDSQRSSGNKAEDRADARTRDANELNRYIYDTTRTDNLPALNSRNSALTQLQQLLGLGKNTIGSQFGSLNRGFTPGDLTKDPGYKFGLQQGIGASDASAAARGGLFSGAQMKALQRYGQDYAGTKYNEAFNRYQAQNDSKFGRLASLAGLGQTGSSQVAAAGQNYANNVGNNLIGLGNIQAANQINQGNQLSNGMNQLAAWASRQNWGQQSNDPYKADGTGMWWDGN